MIFFKRLLYGSEHNLGTLVIRFSLLFFLLFALLLAGGYLYQNHSIKESYMQVRYLALLTENLDKLEKASIELENGLRGFSLTDENLFIESYDKGSDDYDLISKNIVERLGQTPQFETEVKSLIRMGEKWSSQHGTPLLRKSLRGEPVTAEEMTASEASFDSLSEKFADVLERITQQRDLNRSTLLGRISMTLASTGAASLLMIGLYTFFVIRRIKRLIVPLAELDRAVSSYENGQISAELPEYSSANELGRLVRAFGDMRAEMQKEHDQLEDTYRMINALNQAGSVQDVYRETLLGIRSLVRCDRLTVVTLNADRSYSIKAALQQETLSFKETALTGEQKDLRDLIRGGFSLVHENWDEYRPRGVVTDQQYEEGTRSSLHILLKKEARTVGVLNLMSNSPGFFNTVKKTRLEKLAPMIVTAIENALETSKIQSLAMRDGLTGLWNRRRFEESIDELIADACESRPLSLILLDLDRFKRLNDTRGHQEGDLVLQHMARVLQQYSRAGDLPVRFGGEEFAVLLPGTALDEARQVAERLRKLFEVDSPSPDYTVTASFGVAQFRPGQDKHQLIRSADSALYLAKAEGRNRVRLFEVGANPAEPAS
ncbi:diguanylate cyclase [Saccharibacillus sp. CPCC 101409]|uniref:sensor domain-containing diguanylate cyclase n=1 Tax=Saccharibacillus sp. CPCC 101409 TaxID=3058041 RepID=UPI0026726F42|nr:diguanylate cyclase [Saccharibacillus sp. CPCC 101409]MDO3409020.1 diguanylate cyclase [Saccharibacillus sp. CPCC 101409]